MKKIAKRLIGLYLGIVMIFSSSLFVFGQTQSEDVFADQYSETISIDGVTYDYYYTYDIDGNRVVELYDNNTNKTSTIVNDENRGIITENGVTIATIDDIDQTKQSGKKLAASSSWKKESSGTKKISWAKGTSTAAVAAALAAGLGVSGGSLIAIMGLSALGVLAGSTSGGTITWTKYARTRTARKPERKLVWSFKASTGDKYGPYTIMLSQ